MLRVEVLTPEACRRPRAQRASRAMARALCGPPRHRAALRFSRRDRRSDPVTFMDHMLLQHNRAPNGIGARVWGGFGLIARLEDLRHRPGDRTVSIL